MARTTVVAGRRSRKNKVQDPPANTRPTLVTHSLPTSLSLLALPLASSGDLIHFRYYLTCRDYSTRRILLLLLTGLNWPYLAFRCVHFILITFASVASFILIILPALELFCMNAATYYAELIDWLLSHVSDTDMFLLQSAVTCGALFWLLHRAWLTLWKPVPELISILGVDVPDAPEVSLAGIKADAVTLHWSRPTAHKPVVKYLIQVNGVNVGESSRLETAITVTGLKPGHFYNVRVIAVGNNNFQAGSRVIRLRTYGRDGRPELGNGRVPSNLSIEKPPNDSAADSGDESVVIRGHGVGIEAATVLEGGHPMTRERSGGYPGQRRNTGARRHSPSVDQVPPSSARSPEDSMQQLADRLDAIRSDTEDAIAQVSKDAEDYRQQMNDLIKERDEKRQVLKEKEEASEKLKKDVHNSERANRQAQTRKSQKEKVLKDKQAERSKMQSDMVQWKQEIKQMREAQQNWEKESQDREIDTEQKTLEIREKLQEVQASLTAMEEEIRVKGLQIKALEEERQHLPGAQDDEESRRRDAEERYQDSLWDQKQQELIAQVNNQYILCRQLEIDIQKAQSVGAEYRNRQLANPLLYQSSSSGVDFDMAGQNLPKQRKLRNSKSRTNTLDSPINAQTSEMPFPNINACSNMGVTASPTFAAGPYFDLTSNNAMMLSSFERSGMSESDFRSLTDGAPLSPTATSLLPAELFTDDEPGSPQIPTSMPYNLGFPSHRSYDLEPQSPDSSSRSASLMSSPLASHNNMYGAHAQDNNSDGDHGSLNSSGANHGVIGAGNSPGPQQPGGKFLGGIFDFQRPRGKPMQDDGLAFGTLRLGQSQSFPRELNTTDPQPPRPRRTSFSTGWNSLSFLGRNAAAGGDVVEGNGPAPARNGNARRRRGFNMFSSNLDESHPLHPERDPSSPRPASIASCDLPRPSTDSANFGWPAADMGAINRNSPLATNWSIVNNQPWSRAPSRRPSLTHGSSSALATGIASEDDEFLPPGSITHQSSPPPVGVIGTRPSSSHTKPVTPKLNPAAPTFKFLSGRSSKSEKESSFKGKGRIRDFYSSDRSSMDEPFPLDDASPTDTRKSRDNRSIRTQGSIAESHESLGEVISNTPSYEPPSSSTKEASFKQLFRKGSSSKFSFTSKGSFFGGKKGTGSGANSEGRGSIQGDPEDDELGRSVDSVSGSNSSPAGKERNRSINWGRLGFNKRKEGEEEEGL